MPAGVAGVFNMPRSRQNDKLTEETEMKKLLAGLVLGVAVLVSVPNWFPTEARMAETERYQVEAIRASIEDEYLPVDTRFAAADDEILPVDARFASIDEQWQPVETRTAMVDDQVLPIDARLG
jgi:hypothetical protein